MPARIRFHWGKRPNRLVANPREGEPDLILITRFADYPSVAEMDRRNAIMNQRMNQDDHSADAASGQRGKMRRQMGSVLYREILKR